MEIFVKTSRKCYKQKQYPVLSREHVFFAIVAHTILFCCRQNPLPNDDRLYQSLDAGYVFSERKDWPISQHPPTKSIRESVPQWRRSV